MTIGYLLVRKRDPTDVLVVLDLGDRVSLYSLRDKRKLLGFDRWVKPSREELSMYYHVFDFER